MRLVRFDAVKSTNDTALEMARRGEPEGTVVIAGHQTKGRGRRGRSWWGAPGESLFMSVILRPDLPAEEFCRLSFVASLAVAEHLSCEHTLDARVKWPNDVLIDGRKIAGILVETTHAAGQRAAVVGIGVNVNQRSFPPELADLATSVMLETGSEVDVERIAQALAETIFAYYEQYIANGFEEILNRWRKYMWGIGRQAEVRMEGRVLRGAISGVDSTGALVIRDDSGREHTIVSADSITF